MEVYLLKFYRWTCSAVIFLLGSLTVHAQSPRFSVTDRLKADISHARTRADSLSRLNALGQFCTDTTINYLDTAVISLKRSIALADSGRFNEYRLQALKSLAIAYAKKKDLARCRAAYQQVISWYLRHQQVRQAAEAYNWLHLYLYQGSNLNAAMIRESVLCCRKERPLYRQLKDSMGFIGSLKDEADVSMYIRNLDVTDHLLDSVLQLYKKIHYAKLHDVYYLLASSSHLRGDLHRELDYRLKTIAYMNDTGDFSHKGLFLLNLASTYEDIGQLDVAGRYYRAALETGPHSPVFCWYIMRNLLKRKRYSEALVFFNKQKPGLQLQSDYDHVPYNLLNGMYYFVIGDYETAEKFYLSISKYGENDQSTVGDNSEFNYTINREILNFYIMVKDFKKADIYVKKLDHIAKLNISYLLLANIEMYKFKVDSGNHRYVTAIEHYEKNRKMMDSIFSYSRSKQIADLEINYKLKDKDRNILLLQKEATLGEEKYAKKSTFVRLLLLSLLLMMIVLTALYSRFRLKKRSIALLGEKQQEIVRKNGELQLLLNDNEWLVREMHHRVKNNLQIIISLLQSQSTFLKDELALEAVLDSQHRVHAMSLIHQKLYKGQLSTVIYMPEYINDLVEYLRLCFKTGARVLVEQSVEPLYFDVGIAVPVGLILNEILTNCLKYAFSPEQDGRVTIRLYCPDHTYAYLEVSDSGCGLPSMLELDESKSFGMSLIRGLVESDLEGQLTVCGVDGTSYAIRFEINPG